MKRTDMLVCDGKRNGYDVWRTIYKSDDGHYYIHWNHRLINVDKDVESHEVSNK